MTSQHGRHGFRLFPIWAAVLGLVLGFPLLTLASGYGHGGAHHATSKTSPHGAGAMGHGKGYPGGSMHSGHGMKGSMGTGSHGPHQSASKFIDHIWKFKDGMAITDDQVAKLQAIKTNFKKTKIKSNEIICEFVGRSQRIHTFYKATENKNDSQDNPRDKCYNIFCLHFKHFQTILI